MKISTLASIGIKAKRNGFIMIPMKNIPNPFSVIMVAKNSQRVTAKNLVSRERKKVSGSKMHATIVTTSFAILLISVAPPRARIWIKIIKIMAEPSLFQLAMTVPTTINAETRLAHMSVTKVKASGGLTDKRLTRTNVFNLWLT